MCWGHKRNEGQGATWKVDGLLVGVAGAVGYQEKEGGISLGAAYATKVVAGTLPPNKAVVGEEMRMT